MNPFLWQCLFLFWERYKCNLCWHWTSIWMPHCTSGFDKKWIPRRRAIGNRLDAHKRKTLSNMLWVNFNQIAMSRKLCNWHPCLRIFWVFTRLGWAFYTGFKQAIKHLFPKLNSQKTNWYEFMITVLNITMLKCLIIFKSISFIFIFHDIFRDNIDLYSLTLRLTNGFRDLLTHLSHFMDEKTEDHRR